ncbi:Protein phosphatase 1H [Xenoophorus captivus]|uniref:Protein phosphatase 1H n=1 Tax=Xenoophorus captivus TaxID=1517983 RepID=A0ABV0RPI0_9TELE
MSVSVIINDTLKFKVKVYPLSQYEHGADDVLILGTDGLWDVLSNQEVAEVVTGFLANCDPDDRHRHVLLSRHEHSCSRSELNFR